MGSSKQQQFGLQNNALVGSIPDAVALRGTRYVEVILLGNLLRGALPEVLCSQSMLSALWLHMNLLSGSLPGALGRAQSLIHLSLLNNSFAGHIPSAIGRLQLLQNGLAIGRNNIEGALPHGLANLKRLQLLDVSWNPVSGTIPDGVACLPSMRTFRAMFSRLSGTLPQVWSFQNLYLCFNHRLHGTLPDGLFCPASYMIVLSSNNHVGTLPDLSSSSSKLRALAVEDNRLSGSLPATVRSLQALVFLGLSSNAVAGALPSALCSLNRLKGLLWAETMLDGSIPECFGRLAQLSSIELGRAAHGPTLEGSLPAELPRARELTFLGAKGHHLGGRIPKLTSTLTLLALQDNAFEGMSEMFLNSSSAIVLLYANRLSCQLPSCANVIVKQSLVALGNHLAAPKGEFPAWVQPFEQDSLFWVRNGRGASFIARFISGCVIFIMCLQAYLGCFQCMSLVERWQHSGNQFQWQLSQVASSLLSFTGLQLLWSSIQTLCFQENNIYECPSVLTRLSCCFSPSSLARSIAVVLWSFFLSYALRPFWTHHSNAHQKVGRGERILHCVSWALWLVVAWLLCQPAVLMVMTKTIPTFLGGRKGVFVMLLNGCLGVCQTLTSAIIMPSLAGRVSNANISEYPPSRPALVSVASLLVVLLIPAVAFIYLDGACLGRWVQWWAPCSRPHTFDYSHACLGSLNLVRCIVGSGIRQKLVLLEHSDICGLAGHRFSISTCAKSMTLSMQDLLMSKLILSGPLTAGRLVTGMSYRNTDDVFLKLALLLEMGLLAAGQLPVLLPLFYISIIGDGILAAVAWGDGMLTGSLFLGEARTSIVITGLCSLLLNVAITCDSPVLQGILLFMLMRIVQKKKIDIEGSPRL